MRILFFLFLIIGFASCDHPKKPYIEELTWPKRTVKLDNDLGVLTIRLPGEFDTVYRYTFSSCTESLGAEIICFKKSSFPNLIETQFATPELDSLYHFTISYASQKGNSVQIKLDSNYLESWISRQKADDKFNG